MNKNWKREILIFTIICIFLGLIGLGMSIACHLDLRLPMVVIFVIDSALASLIEHRLEEKEKSLAK